MSKVQLNFRVEEETRSRIEELARETHRGLGDVIDWLVQEKYRQIFPPPEVQQQDSTHSSEMGILSAQEG